MRPRFIQHVVSTFGIMMLQQVLGLGRQVLVAAYFGLTREYDQYLVVYATATIAVFGVAMVFDTVALSRLTRIRESEGDEALWRASNRLLIQALIGGLLFAGVLIAAVNLLMPVIAAGFNGGERTSLSELTLYFTLWVVVIVPYYAVSVHLKALWGFHWVFGSEILAIVVSALVLWLWHDSIECLPIAYGVGYSAAFIVLLIRRGLHVAAPGPAHGMLHDMGNQHLANQVGSLAGFADRYFQSYLPAGGISALGYTALIVNNLSSLLTFREIYIVPLSRELGRNERVGRMLQGVVLISIPCAIFVTEFAHPIIEILFQRGKFTPEAAELASNILRITAYSVVISSVLAPIERLFQILDRISYSYIRYLVSLVGTVLFQYVLVFKLGWGVYGVAWSMLANSLMVTVVVVGLVWHCGVAINWRPVFVNALFAAAISGAAALASWPLVVRFPALIALAGGGAAFGLAVGLCYFLARKRLRLIIG